MTLPRTLALTVERVVAPVEGMHRAISSGWFRALGPVARPVRVAHDAVVGGVYGAIRTATDTIARGIEASSPPGPGPRAEPARAWVNGLWGDALGRHASLAIDMVVLDVHGTPIVPEEPTGAAGESPPPRLVFLVHGLVETERRWQGSTGEGGLVRALRDAGLSPVLVRYNTGLPVDDNGERLAQLVDRVVQGWPEPIGSIGLVGHSMGGLVARAAHGHGVAAGYGWVERLTDLVTIGTPHAGAPLEGLARAAAWGLGVADVTRPLGAFLDGRSRGIKDLGGRSAGAGPALATSHVRHRTVAGVVTRDPRHPIGSVLGDLMVRPSSATSPRGVEVHDRALVGGVDHFRLPDHPTTIEQVVTWLQEPPTVPWRGPPAPTAPSPRELTCAGRAAPG